MDLLSIVVPLLVALAAGGGVAFFTAKPQKDSIIAAASKNAVEVVNSAITRLETESKKLRVENKDLRERVTILENEGEDLGQRLALAQRISNECRRRIRELNKAIIALGGTVEHKDDILDSADYDD